MKIEQQQTLHRRRRTDLDPIKPGRLVRFQQYLSAAWTVRALLIEDVVNRFRWRGSKVDESDSGDT
jgi:hypothetical protein